MTGDGLATQIQGFFVAAVLALGGLQPAFAACALTTNPDSIRAFIDDALPSLRRAPAGGSGLSIQIRTYAATTDEARKAIGRMAKQANLAQKAAIGRGLGLAFQSCAGQSAGIDRRITDLVSEIGDSEVSKYFGRQLADGDDGRPKSDAAPGNDLPSRSLGLDQIIDPRRPLPLPGVAPLPTTR
jgi:hypothetical protein